MKSFSLLFLVLFASLTVFSTSHKVLFIGNSYTSVNDLPQLIKNVAISNGDTLVYSSHVPGGCTFAQHLSGAASLIQQGGWDYVVLQEQSQLPSFPESQFMQESYPYAQQLCQMIRQYNPDAKVVFYMTWGRKNGDQQNCPYFPPLCTYEGMDSLLNARYVMMANDNEADVSPVGYVWHYLRDHNPDIELYQSDESHPTMAGSYAAACCFYAMLFEKDPSQISNDCGLSSDYAQTIRDVASRLVYDSLSRWQYNGQDTSTIGIIDFQKPVLSVYPNPANTRITVDVPFETESAIEIYTIDGRLVKRVDGIVMMKQEVEISDLNEGVYLIRVVGSDNKISTGRFVKSSL